VLGKTLLILRCFAIICFIFLTAIAKPCLAEKEKPGFGILYPLISIDPEDLHGYRFSAFYQPKPFIWKYFKLYVDTSYGRWFVDEIPYDYPAKRALSIVAIAPVGRLYYKLTPSITPFIDISVGLSYLSETRIYKRNLGMHFAFQDIGTIGASFGPKENVSVSFGAMHYSNCSFSPRNSGITMPLILSLGYRF